jgi:predicted dehydrogenase
MVAAARKAKRHIAMGYNYRFMTPYIRVKRIIDSGQLGEPVFINIRTNLNAWCHMLDLMRWFMGEVTSLAAFTSGPTECPDKAVTLRFASGAIGTLIGSMRLAMFHPVNRIEIGGTKERLTVDDLAGPLHRYSNVKPERSMIGPPEKMSWQGYFDSFHNHTKAMIRQMMARKVPPSTGIDGLRELQLQAAMVISSKEKRFVKPY